MTLTLFDRVKQWQSDRTVCADEDTDRVDSVHAAALGLPVLSALCDLADRLQRARSTLTPAEMLAELRPIISLARGEAQERLRIHTGCTLELPGLCYVPHPLVERTSSRRPSPAEAGDLP
jgi:hypothetical protein